MRRVKIILSLVAVLVLIILSFQNPAPVEFKFLWMQVQVPKIILIVVSGIVGSLATLVIQFLLRNGARQRGTVPPPQPPTPSA